MLTRVYAITNNYDCICEGCLEDIRMSDLYQPAFKVEIPFGECEDCGFIKYKDGIYAIREYMQVMYPYHEPELWTLEGDCIEDIVWECKWEDLGKD